MDLSESAVSELLDAFRAGDGVDLIRESVRLMVPKTHPPMDSIGVSARGFTLEVGALFDSGPCERPTNDRHEDSTPAGMVVSDPYDAVRCSDRPVGRRGAMRETSGGTRSDIYTNDLTVCASGQGSWSQTLRQPQGVGSLRWSDGDDVEQRVQPLEIGGVAGVEGKGLSEGGGCDEEVYGPTPTRFPARGDDSGVDASVGAGGFVVERQWVERGFGPLQSVLSSCPLDGVGGRVGARSKLGHRERADGHFSRETCRVDDVKIDDHRGVDEASRWARLSHEAWCPGRRSRRGRFGTSGTRSAERHGTSQPLLRR